MSILRGNFAIDPVPDLSIRSVPIPSDPIRSCFSQLPTPIARAKSFATQHFPNFPHDARPSSTAAALSYSVYVYSERLYELIRPFFGRMVSDDGYFNLLYPVSVVRDGAEL